MLKENCIKILGTGLSYIKTAYKNVILDIDQAEKEQKADSYTFSAEGFIPLLKNIIFPCVHSIRFRVLHHQNLLTSSEPEDSRFPMPIRF